MRTSLFVILLFTGAAGCHHDLCDAVPCGPSGGGGTSAGGSGAGGTGHGGAGGMGGTGGAPGGGGIGGGGSPPCGGTCEDPTPLCNENTGECVACLMDDNCDSVGTAHCDNGNCVACSDSGQCSHLPGTLVCDAGTCVECALGDETACTGGTTCDLLAETCTGSSAGSVTNCNACTNDLQCGAGHRCIQMDFNSSPHGYYCLKDSAGGCAQPFGNPINEISISGAPAVNYCGIEEDSATCEAVLALLNNWRCSGTDGMCSPDGVQPEIATPGALCRQVGVLANRCTYECAGAGECLSAGPGGTCGGAPPPNWCGG